MRIKVTGIINTEDMQSWEIDTAHAMGVSEQAYSAYVSGAAPLPRIYDLEFEAIPE